MTFYFGAAFPSLCPLTALDRTDAFALKAGVRFAVKQQQLSTMAREWRREPSRPAQISVGPHWIPAGVSFLIHQVVRGIVPTSKACEKD